MRKFIGAVLLIIGTSVGAGMLGLPVETAKSGLVPSLVLFLMTWFVMMLSGFFLTEVTLLMKKQANFVSMSQHILGKGARLVTFCVYIVLFFSLITAYVKGGGGFFLDQPKWSLSPWQGGLIFLFLFAPFVSLGTKLVDQMNLLLIFFLFASYLGLIFLGMHYVNGAFFSHQNFSEGFLSLPLIITAFAFHGTLPTLIDYLERDVKKIRAAIVCGSTVTLFIYVLWQLVALGIVPLHGENSLSSALIQDQTAIIPIRAVIKNKWILTFSNLFSFTALSTSFLGVSIGMIDFLSDAFRLKRTVKNRTLICSVMYLAAFLLSLTKMRIFYISLKYGAGFACVYLLIFLPLLMKVVSRRKIKHAHLKNTERFFELFTFAFICAAVFSIIKGLVV